MTRRGRGRGTTHPRAKWHIDPIFMVECQEQDCPWPRTGESWGFPHAPAELDWRDNPAHLAAAHHDSTGHVVKVERSEATIYGEDGPDQPRWWKKLPGESSPAPRGR